LLANRSEAKAEFVARRAKAQTLIPFSTLWNVINSNAVL